MKRRTTATPLMLALLWAAPVLGQDAHEDAAFEDSVWTALESHINALDVVEVQASPLNPSRPKMKPSAVHTQCQAFVRRIQLASV